MGFAPRSFRAQVVMAFLVCFVFIALVIAFNYFRFRGLAHSLEVLELAERTRYDIDRIAAAFGESFEQVCHRLTTLQRDGAIRRDARLRRADQSQRRIQLCRPADGDRRGPRHRNGGEPQVSPLVLTFHFDIRS